MPSGSHFAGGRYGRGEVGEFVLIEGQQSLILGRIAEVSLREAERRSIRRDFAGNNDLDALGSIQLLGCVSMDTLRVTAGVDAYPRLGDRIYSAPHRFIALLPELMERADTPASPVTLDLGTVDGATESHVAVRPERLFGRHCAILGATGGGKSWTTARIIEESIAHNARIILIDATGEYRGFGGGHVVHTHLGMPSALPEGAKSCTLPPSCFRESDFLALFEPAGKVQGPKLRAAIRSLRLAQLRPHLAPQGFVQKIFQKKAPVAAAEADPSISGKLDNPRQPFDPHFLVQQLEQECCWPDGGTFSKKDATVWGGGDDASFSHCLSLVARINGVLASPAFSAVFAAATGPALTSEIDAFVAGPKRLLRIDLSGVSFEFFAREIIANVIGRHLLDLARTEALRNSPVVVFVDEAHNFLGRSAGSEESAARLDAFELIAKEGRKFGLTLCLASQRPRDITEGVLSQMGTLIVHRLTNDRDREVVERACGEIDRAASAFLPNLRPGEAAIIGTDFPIPLTVRLSPPNARPLSDGPDFQTAWTLGK